MADKSYTDADQYEAAVDALDGAFAVGVLVQDAVCGEQRSRWSESIIDSLMTAQRVLLNEALSKLDDLRKECWRANALLGKYGADAKRRAEAELVALERTKGDVA